MLRKKTISLLLCMLMIGATFYAVANNVEEQKQDVNPPVSPTDWDPADGHKMHYPQLPDEDGWDVYATSGLAQYSDVMLADDWQCSESGPVSEIHFWGSWLNGYEGIIDSFVIEIHEDIPADPPNVPYSRPGVTLWERTFMNGEWMQRPVDSPEMQGWYNPANGDVFWDDHQPYFQYNFMDVPDPFIQIEGEIYWLAVTALVLPEEEPQPLWGWKSSEDHFNDDACWTYWGDPNWQEMYEPSPPPITNNFWIEFDPVGIPIVAGGTDYYDDGASFNGWYYYENTDWWNIWFYDHPLDPERYKDIFVAFDWFPTGEPYYIEVAIDWSTDLWPPGLPPPVPPLSPPEEEMYIGREIIPIDQPGFVEYFYTILDYNPEWVSIDVRGFNFAIPQGSITHECIAQNPQSLDLAFVINGEQLSDFGDAPDPTYPTLLASNGAQHTIVPGIFLGHTIDAEPNGQPSFDALGDDITPMIGPDDEDGVIFTTLAIAGNTVQTKVIASIDGYFNGWVDFNADGDWDDAGEQIFTDVLITSGVNWLTFSIPSTAAGTTYSRFRFCTQQGLSYDGAAPDGEVEDYRVFILRPIDNAKMHWPQYPDLDNTGMDVDMFYFPLADDFLCTETGPILDIHFWGSFADDILPAAGGPGSLTFQVQLFSDIPADQNPNGFWSQPGELLWEALFEPGTYDAYQVADNNPEDWWDPASGLWIDDNHLNCYQYDFYIDEEFAFIQEEGTIYWLCIKDILPPQPDYTFGWKTTMFDLRWNDDATFAADWPVYWLPLTYPFGHEFAEESLDLAFVITGGASSPCVCGDANGDGAVNVGDAVYLINYVFKGGPAPVPFLCCGDANGDGAVNVGDAVYLINYVFKGGPAPVEPCCNPIW